MPVMKFKSCAKPSTYAYPPLLEPPKEKEKEKVSLSFLTDFFVLNSDIGTLYQYSKKFSP